MKAQAFNENWLFGIYGQETRVAITLPHDAMIHEPRDPAAPGGSGHAFFPGGKYIYEKVFYCPADWEGQTVLLHFGGVYRNAQVSLNGEALAWHAYGYTDFTVDLSAGLRCGANNTVTVEVDNTQMPNSRWYSGSGIYRPVELITGGPVHIGWQGLRVTTVGVAPARVRVETSHTGGAAGESQPEVAVAVFDGDTLLARGTGEKVELDLPGAALWSAESPKLYLCRASLLQNGQTVDTAETWFGIRQIAWGPEGLLINGRETLLRGGCIHHDNGVLGAAAPPEVEERKVRLLKEAGFNAIRSAHNPASEALLAACDRYGLYVMDESWDMWYKHKRPHDYAGQFMEGYQADLGAMVEKDYNHPSVIMYSIGNEVAEPVEERGMDLARELVARLHELDGTRPVTAGINLSILTATANGNPLYKEEGGRADDSVNQTGGMNSTMFNMMAAKVGPAMNNAANGPRADKVTSPVLDALDIAGYNYASGRYKLEGEKHPDRVLVGSETFPQDIWKNWRMVERLPYLIGDFMWVAWDYLGECGIGTWAYTADAKVFDKPYPWLLADCGALDILGDPNGEMFWAQAAWGMLKDPVIAVRPVDHPGDKLIKSVWRGANGLPCWSWQGCEGYPATVEVYGCGESVKLLLDGRSVGKKRLKEGRALFKLRYAPGELTAVLYDGKGRETGRSSLFSAVGQAKACLEPEKLEAAPGETLCIPITLRGTNGVRACAADRVLTATVEGGELLAFGSAAPRTEERYDVGECTTYYGRAMAVVRAAKPGSLVLTVRDGRQERSAVIRVG